MPNVEYDGSINVDEVDAEEEVVEGHDDDKDDNDDDDNVVHPALA